MSITFPVPADLVVEVMGYGTEENPRILIRGDVTRTYEELGEIDENGTVDMTLPELTQVIGWAFADADEDMPDMEDAIEGTDPIHYIFGPNTSACDRARFLVQFLFSKIADYPNPYTKGSSTLSESERRRIRDMLTDIERSI